SSMRSGSHVLPQLSGHGKAVAPRAMNPVRHSSCTIAGMPRRVSSTRRRCNPLTMRAPSAAATGALPNGRVTCPSPCSMRSPMLRWSASATKFPWYGATSPVEGSSITHSPTSCATFSSRVMAASNCSGGVCGGLTPPLSPLGRRLCLGRADLVGARVHGGAVDADLEVHVGAGRVAGGALVPDDLTLADALALAHRHARLVGVAGDEAAAVVDE